MHRIFGLFMGLALALSLPAPCFAGPFDANPDDPASGTTPPAAATPAAPAAAPATPPPAAPLTPIPSASADSVPSADSNVMLRAFAAKGVVIHYLGRTYGLDGWLLTKDSDLQVIYTTLDGQAALAGTLYGPTGELETSKQLLAAREKGLIGNGATVVPPPIGGINVPSTVPPAAAAPVAAAPAATASTPPSERLWKEIQGSAYLKYGPDSAPPFYVIMDPRCHYCHDLYMTVMQKYVPQNKMQLRVIPAGILSPDSAKEAESIMTLPDPTKAWDAAENGQTSDLPSPSDAAIKKITTNSQIMTEWKFQGTPTCVYRDKSGKVKMVVGIPADMDTVVNNLASE